MGPRKTGITPACAGKRNSIQLFQSLSWDHPRVCGEKDLLPECDYCRKGSPPRVRGKANANCVGTHKTGITPACAGKSHAGPGNGGTGQDHPRVCGEKLHCSSPAPVAAGSPPRVRGKAAGASVGRLVVGITPACAGKSMRCRMLHKTHWDHPRVCGEKLSFGTVAQIPLGSPPRVRGKEVQIEQTGVRAGITPACAGKSCQAGQESRGAQDHPLVCGEKRFR